jgi:acyl-CoA synthetase (AMP-forming)/AMP-acid ligase II
MGRPLPGYPVVLLDAEDHVSEAEGEICLRLDERPLGLTDGYADDDAKTSDAMRGGYYHTGDIASRDADGYLTFVGRADDVFKASDYRLSPFELESVLIEHPSVAEAAVIPSPDPLRHTVPKAFVTLVPGVTPSREVAADIFSYCKTRSRRTNESGASSSRICRRPFQERSGASSCGPWNRTGAPRVSAARTSSSKTNWPNAFLALTYLRIYEFSNSHVSIVNSSLRKFENCSS